MSTQIEALKILKEKGLTFGNCLTIFGVDSDTNPYSKAALENINDDGHIEIANPTVISEGEDAGVYVLAWVWVDTRAISSNEEADKECTVLWNEIFTEVTTPLIPRYDLLVFELAQKIQGGINDPDDIDQKYELDITDISSIEVLLQSKNTEEGNNILTNIEAVKLFHDSKSKEKCIEDLQCKFTHCEMPLYHRGDWLYEVRNNDTSLGYWPWVYSKLDEAAHVNNIKEKIILFL